MDAWFFENWPWRACRGKWFCQCCSYHFKRILSWHLYEGADGLLEATLCYMAVNMSIFRMCCLSQMNKSHLTVSWFNIHFHPKKNIKQDVMTWILTRIHYKEHCQRKVSRRLPVPSGQQNKKKHPRHQSGLTCSVRAPVWCVPYTPPEHRDLVRMQICLFQTLPP